MCELSRGGYDVLIVNEFPLPLNGAKLEEPIGGGDLVLKPTEEVDLMLIDDTAMPRSPLTILVIRVYCTPSIHLHIVYVNSLH